MSSVTQLIPTLTGGISQQADELKVPGQLNVADNVLPDITHGLMKRPGGKLVASFSDGTNNSVTNGKWFHYYRDEKEQYIGQVSRTGDINMWICGDNYEENTTNTATFTRSSATITVTKSSHGLTTNDFIDIVFSGNTTATNNRYQVVSVVDTNNFTITDTASGTISNTACTYGKRLKAAGDEMTVTYDSSTSSALTSYLTHSNDEDIQTLTVNDYTFLTNRLKTVAMDSTVEAARPPEVYLELDQIKYASQYSLNLFDNTTTTSVSTATRISVELVRSSNNYCTSSGAMSSHTARVNNTTRCSGAGESSDDRAPNVATRIFDITSGGTLVDTNATSTVGGTDFSYQVNIYNSSGTSGQTGRKNLYFRITTTGQSTPVGSGSNVEYRTRYTTTNDLLYGGEGWQTGDHVYVYMKDGYYKVTVEDTSTTEVQANLGLIRPTPTSFDTKTTVTGESILGTLRQEIIDTGNFTSANVQQIGNGLYITRASGSFNASTPNSRLMNVVSGEVLTVEDLPKQCKHGFVVKVANSQSEDDDYYLKFFGNNDRDGDGVWEECVKPGVQIRYDKATMPIQLIRTNATTFTLSQVTWEDAQAGDTDALNGTNPRASFVGKQINKMIFFRNRLCMLSDENVIMSRPGNFFNFWAKTATTFSNVDVIDLSVSSEYPAIVYDAIQINAGLLLFTKNQQFMLTTDSDILNPSTAKINALASYNFNHKTNPISLGTTVGFLDNANKYSRFFEMSRLLREGEPTVVEQSKVVSKLFAKDLKLISNSRENSLIFFSEEDTSTLYGYRYFSSGNERPLESWFTWTVTGLIRYHCMLDDALFVVVSNDNKDQLLRYSVKLDDLGHYVTDGEDYPIHLDHSTSVTTNANAFNSVTNKTTVAKPTGFESISGTIVAFDTDSGNNLGRYAVGTVNGSNVEFYGNWSSETFVIGYLFEMKIELPTLYFQYPSGENWRSDTRSDLIIHRIKFSFGDIGVYSITIDRKGKPSYTEQREVNNANTMNANTLTFLDRSLETIPCYERNKTLTVKVTSQHPSPATIVGFNWEGDYNTKSYKRV